MLKLDGFVTLIQVFDMPTSLAFYREVMGFTALSDVPEDGRCDWVWLKCGESELMLNTAYEADDRPDKPDPARVGAHSDVILYFACEDVDAAYRCFCARGIAAKEPTIAFYGMKQVYLKDPDGYEICVQQPVETTVGT